jgi:hypothetical protein
MMRIQYNNLVLIEQSTVKEFKPTLAFLRLNFFSFIAMCSLIKSNCVQMTKMTKLMLRRVKNN